MGCFLPRILVILTACSTVLAGIPLIAAAPQRDLRAGDCLASAPFDTDGASGSRGENVASERGEDLEEDVDAEAPLFLDRLPGIDLSSLPSGMTEPGGRPATAGCGGPTLSIRGPPAR